MTIPLKDFTPSKNPGLRSASLKTMYINRKDLVEGIFYDATTWEVQADLFLTSYLKEHPVAKAVVSFQVYKTNFEHVAVARLHRDLI